MWVFTTTDNGLSTMLTGTDSALLVPAGTQVSYLGMSWTAICLCPPCVQPFLVQHSLSSAGTQGSYLGMSWTGRRDGHLQPVPALCAAFLVSAAIPISALVDWFVIQPRLATDLSLARRAARYLSPSLSPELPDRRWDLSGGGRRRYETPTQSSRPRRTDRRETIPVGTSTRARLCAWPRRLVGLAPVT